MTDAMTQFKTEGQNPFENANTEKDNSAAPSAENTNTDQTQSHEGENTQAEKKDGGADNFAEHPRWKERESDWTKRFNEQEQRHVSEMAKFREDIEKRFSEVKPNKAESTENAIPEIPEWFNGDEKQWVQFNSWNQGLVKQAEDNILKRQGEEQKKLDAATTYFNEQVTAFESDKALNPKGEKIDRNKLLKFTIDNDLVDSQGRWNYRAAYQLMKAGAAEQAKPAPNTDRKNLAGATTSENRAETKEAPYKTSADFRKPGERPW